ncbi:MAG: hypothetical protein ACSLE0_16080 [Chitinophagaceae bacterium]
MKKNNYISARSLKRFTFLILLGACAFGAFATLGTPGRGKKSVGGKSLLSNKTANNTVSFSLRSGFNFRGNQVITQENKYIDLNTVVSYQQGHTTYIMPLKKKIALNGKITFNPNAETR